MDIKSKTTMILHYIKIAYRSLMKYRLQSVLSIVGLALGFVSFALSVFWVRYEQTYDSFHRDAGRMFLLGHTSLWKDNQIDWVHHSSLAEELRQTFPEVEEAVAFECWRITLKRSEHDAEQVSMGRIRTDSLFVRFFDLKLLDGSWSFLNVSDEVALTKSGARQLFGTTEVLGREVYYGGKAYRVSAILPDWGSHTNFPFSVVMGIDPAERDNPFWGSNFYVCLRLRSGTDGSAFATQLNRKRDALRHVPKGVDGQTPVYSLEPLTDCRYTVFQKEHRVSVFYIRLFAVLGLLLIVLALVNFLSLLVSRMHLRRRELALRVVCGSSRSGLAGLFLSELLWVLLGAGLLGMLLVVLVERPFCTLAEIDEGIRNPVAGWFLLLIAGTLLVAWGLIVYYCRRIAARQLQPAALVSSGRFTFQQMSLTVQFFISALVLFCMSFLLLQLHYLTYSDFGFEREGRATVKCHGSKTLEAHLVHELQRQPFVFEVKQLFSLLPQVNTGGISTDSWEGKAADAPPLHMTAIPGGQEFMDFYGIRLLSGNYLSEQGDSLGVIVNETAVRRLGMAQPLGKKIDKWTIVGVVRDFHVSAPTVPVEPVIFFGDKGPVQLGTSILVRFDESRTDRLKHFVDSVVHAEDPGTVWETVTVREAYDKYLYSERSMLRLLSVVALVSVLITLIGVFAHVSLACERHRREIAIRKVNGATAGSIFRLFLKHYFALLLLACLVAFPLGSIVMWRWMERYVERMAWPWWLYAVIFLGLGILIVLCIWRSVWRAASENPAEVIKRE